MNINIRFVHVITLNSRGSLKFRAPQGVQVFHKGSNYFGVHIFEFRGSIYLSSGGPNST